MENYVKLIFGQAVSLIPMAAIQTSAAILFLSELMSWNVCFYCIQPLSQHVYRNTPERAGGGGDKTCPGVAFFIAVFFLNFFYPNFLFNKAHLASAVAFASIFSNNTIFCQEPPLGS